MRHIIQPGPVDPRRIHWAEARGRHFSMKLERGKRLLDAVQEGFLEAGFVSGVINFDGGALGPFSYVMPALSRTREHAAFYSATFRPAGTSRIKAGALTFGTRDGQPFFHCHALWTENNGQLAGGHILPEETCVAETFAADAMGIDGAGFAAQHDPETGFRLFCPHIAKTLTENTDRRLFVLRLGPNQDFATALEQFCAEKDIRQARLHGGVGSLIGSRFTDGRSTEPFATEIAVRSGRIEPEASGALAASLEIVLVDYTGTCTGGMLRRGDNPVLMTMELVLEVI